MKSCRTCGTKIHLKVLPSSTQSLYNTPSSLMNIFCSSVSLCNFFATSLQYVSFFCSCCNCFGFNGSLISLRSSCSVISMQGYIRDSRECFSKFATATQSSFFCWLFFELYLKSLNRHFLPRSLRMFLKFAVSILHFLFICFNILYYSLLFQWLSRFLRTF